jgi:hypothetical protein
VGEPSPAQRGGGNDGDREPQPIHPTSPLHLVAETDVEDAVASMCRIWGVFVTAGVLGQYRETLEGLPAAAVLEAIKRWLRRPPADRAARPHELRAMAEKHAAAAQANSPGHRPGVSAAPQGPQEDLDAIFAELAELHPDNTVLRSAIERRARDKALGHPAMTPEQTALWLAGGVIAGKAMPQGEGS